MPNPFTISAPNSLRGKLAGGQTFLPVRSPFSIFPARNLPAALAGGRTNRCCRGRKNGAYPTIASGGAASAEACTRKASEPAISLIRPVLYAIGAQSSAHSRPPLRFHVDHIHALQRSPHRLSDLLPFVVSVVCQLGLLFQCLVSVAALGREQQTRGELSCAEKIFPNPEKVVPDRESR